MAGAGDEIDRDLALANGAGLANGPTIEADEVGILAAHRCGQNLIADELACGPGDQLVEIRLDAHSAPPKTSIAENRHAGEA